MALERIEEELLTMLLLKPDICIDLLQIKPDFLFNKKNKLLLEGIIYSYNNHGIINLASVSTYKNELIEYITDLLANDLLPLTEIRKQFMITQKKILDSYKKRVIKKLTDKLTSGTISCDEYLKKMCSINEVTILDELNILTIEEINNNISSSKVRIDLKNFPKLNETLNLVQNDLIIIGANTGVGKSGLLLNIMNDLMNEYQCIYFNMEMSKTTIYQRIISIKSDVPIKYIENPSTYQSELIENSLNEIISNKIIIEHKAIYIEDIKNLIARSKNDEKHSIIFLDHIGLIKCRNSKTIYEQTTYIAKELRQICLNYNCTIISACQLNRTSINSNELNLSMLKDSGEIENSSSKVILLYKNKQDISKEKFVDNVVLDIVKNRDGRLGKIAFKYDKTKQIFREDTNYS